MIIYAGYIGEEQWVVQVPEDEPVTPFFIPKPETEKIAEPDRELVPAGG